MIFKTLFLVLMVALVGCVIPTSNKLTTHGPDASLGKFAVERIAGSSTARNISIGSVTVKDSNLVLFILKNSGGTPITNISLSVSGDNIERGDFTITPNGITSLDPDSSSQTTTLIRVDINHGFIFGVVGQPNYISPLVSTATINISGDNGGGPGSVSLDADLSTVIDLAGWVIEDANGVAADQQSVGDGIYNNAGTANDHVVYVRNTGNVNIKVADTFFDSSWTSFSNGPTSATTTLTPGQRVALGSNVPDNPGTSDFSVDTLGVVFNNGTNGLQFLTGTSKVSLHTQSF